MKKSRSCFCIFLLAGLWLTGAVQAAPPEFSADTYQKSPQGDESSGRIFVGQGRIRTEMSQNGQTIVQITDTREQVTWVIFPAQRSYMEQRVPGPAAVRNQGGEKTPCSGIPGASCNKLGEEEISGRPTGKWDISVTRQGKTLRGTQWVDAERGTVLREEMPNGQRTELKMLGLEEVGGRTAEKWEMTVSQSDKAPQRFNRWYDPELDIEIRQEYPGGFIREMRNIQVGRQNPDLFEVPAGFKNVTPQQQTPDAKQ